VFVSLTIFRAQLVSVPKTNFFILLMPNPFHIRHFFAEFNLGVSE